MTSGRPTTAPDCGSRSSVNVPASAGAAVAPRATAVAAASTAPRRFMRAAGGAWCAGGEGGSGSRRPRRVCEGTWQPRSRTAVANRLAARLSLCGPERALDRLVEAERRAARERPGERLGAERRLQRLRRLCLDRDLERLELDRRDPSG